MNPKYFDMAAEIAAKAVKDKVGEPFGSTIVRFPGTDKEEVVAVSSNTMFKDYDPTAHAETVCIREACQKLKTLDLSDCVIYATGAPCPMCQAAIVWAKIPVCYYNTDYDELAKNGCSSAHVKESLSGKNKVVEMIHTPGNRASDELWVKKA